MSTVTRTENEVFEDLRALCTSPGYVHAFVILAVRESMIAYADEMTPGMASRIQHEKTRVIRTERSVLLGLMVGRDIDYREPSPATIETYLRRTEALLEELQQILVLPMTAGLKDIGTGPIVDPFDSGVTLREPMFYGTEGAHSFQYRELTPKKYALDADWLQEKLNWSAETASAVLATISRTIDAAVTEILNNRDTLTSSNLIRAHSFTADSIAATLGLALAQVESVLKPFVLGPQERNEGFRTIYDFNITNAKPILRTEEGSCLLLQQASLAEALYEAPFFWMVSDREYAPTALTNRGKFTERFCQERLARVFGESNVLA